MKISRARRKKANALENKIYFSYIYIYIYSLRLTRMINDCKILFRRVFHYVKQVYAIYMALWKTAVLPHIAEKYNK